MQRVAPSRAAGGGSAGDGGRGDCGTSGAGLSTSGKVGTSDVSPLSQPVTPVVFPNRPVRTAVSDARVKFEAEYAAPNRIP